MIAAANSRSRPLIRRRRLRSPITWFGGKGHVAHHIVPLLPPHQCYLEPFFGGGSVFWAKPPVALETINDIDDGVVHLYRVLRDPARFAAFERLCQLTPYARVEFEACRRLAHEDPDPDPVRRAWAWFVCVRQAFGGATGTGARSGWKYSVTMRDTPQNSRETWGYRTGNVGNSAGRRWLSAVEMLPEIHERLRHVQIEHGDWRRVMDAYATHGGVCVYLDPPYVMATRGRHSKRYAYELADALNAGGRIWTISPRELEADIAAHRELEADIAAHRELEADIAAHRELEAYLLACPAMCVLSGYYHGPVHDTLAAAGWERRDVEVPLSAARHRAGQRRTETIWRNPAAVAAWTAAQAQQRLFTEIDEVIV